MPTTGPGRPNRVVVDSAAFRHNLALLRELLGRGRQIWQVCKGDGYGLGTALAAGLGADCGVDGVCAGTPEEALVLRDLFPAMPVLLFPSADAADLPALARHGVIVTAHNAASLRSMLATPAGSPFFVKVDTGLHRFGFDLSGFAEALDLYRRSGHDGLRCVYTHLGQAQSGSEGGAFRLFDRFLRLAEAGLGRPVPGMAAASHSILAFRDAPYEKVDPGRLLYGMLPSEETGGHDFRPVVRSVTSRLIEIRQLEAGEAGSIGYAAARLDGGRIGAFPLGHFDGLPAQGPLGTVLVRGVEAPVVARTLLASMVDVTDVPGAALGDDVVIVGRSGTRERTIHQYADSLNASATQLHFQFVRQLPKVLA